MALITPIQAQTMLDNSAPKCVCIDGEYYQWQFCGNMDGYNYYCNTKSHGDTLSDGELKDSMLALTLDSTETEVKAVMQSYFETQTYLGIKPVIS